MKTLPKSTFLITWITYMVAFLLLFSGLEKLFHFSVFRMQLKLSPWIWIAKNSNVIAWVIPFVEIFISILLLNSTTRMLGFGISVTMFTGFAYYMYWIQTAKIEIVCGCNSFIQNFSVLQHIWFNLFFALLSITGLVISKIKYSKKAIAIRGMGCNLISSNPAELPNK